MFKNLILYKKYPRITSIGLYGILATMFSVSFRYIIFLHFEMAIFNIVDYPLLSFSSLFNINIFRLFIRNFLEEILIAKISLALRY